MLCPTLPLGETGQGAQPHNSETTGVFQDASATGDVIVSSSTPVQLKAEGGRHYVVTGTAAQQIRLPKESQLMRGAFFSFVNKSTGTMSIRTSFNQILVLASNGSVNPTTVLAWMQDPLGNTAPLSWAWVYIATTIATGKTFAVNNSITLNGQDGMTYTFPPTTSAMAAIDLAQTFSFLQTFFASIHQTPVLLASLGAAAGLGGRRAFISNAVGPVPGAVAVGGGGIFAPVYSDNVNWIIG